MKWASHITTRSAFPEALKECASKTAESLQAPADLGILFISPHHRDHFLELPQILAELLPLRVLIGCSGGGIIGEGKEVENFPAVSLTAAVLPEVSLQAFHLEEKALPSLDASPKAWKELLQFSPQEGTPHFIILADPFSFNPENFVKGLDYAFPESTKIGGLASGTHQPNGNVLYLNRNAHLSGAVILKLSGNIEVDPIISQGCRPIGEPYRVTLCEKNVLMGINGESPMSALEKLIENLSPNDQNLAQTSLFLGILNDPLKREFKSGDFLIRNLLSIDPTNGALAIGALLRPGQTVQFHLRDKTASAEDLKQQLSNYQAQKKGTAPKGAVLFSCMGRGKHLYQQANHDSDLFHQCLGDIPIGGFFCNGEIGPVMGATFLHGYTSCFGLFRSKKHEGGA